VSSYPPPPPPPPGYGPPPGGPYGGYGPPPGGPPPGGPYGYPGGYGPARTTNALVCGVASLITCALPVGIAAVILGPMAKREIAAQPDRYDGTGMALAGQILGWIAVALMVGFVAFVVLAIILDSSSSSFESLAA
jgi:hypothetical protein